MGTETSVEHPNGTAFGMYHADQYMAPEGSYETVTMADNSTWYRQYATDTVERTPYMTGEGKMWQSTPGTAMWWMLPPVKRKSSTVRFTAPAISSSAEGPMAADPAGETAHICSQKSCQNLRRYIRNVHKTRRKRHLHHPAKFY